MENVTIQEYADTYCSGDRFRAIYELLHKSDEPGSFDKYIDELSSIEASFVMVNVKNVAKKSFNGEKGFNKALKAERLTNMLCVDLDKITPESKNPYKSELLMYIFGGILSLALVALIAITKFIPLAFLYVCELFVCINASFAAKKFIKLIYFNKLKKYKKELPHIQNKEKTKSTFEEIMTEFFKLHPPVKKSMAESIVKDLKSKTIYSSVFLTFGSILLFISFIVSVFNKTAGLYLTLSISAILTVIQSVFLYKCIKLSCTVLYITDADEDFSKKLQRKLKSYRLSSLGIIFLVFLVILISCTVSISIALF